MEKNILVIEDDPAIEKILRQTLQAEGYRIVWETSLENSLKAIHTYSPALVILDLIIPGTDGLEICRRLKRDPQTISIPILILSSRNEEADVVAGLELGAEDYITKPFSPRVLLTRVRAILRRNNRQDILKDNATVHYANFKIDPQRFEVKHGIDTLVVTRSEFRILHLLFNRPGWVFSRKQILQAIHGEETPVTIRSVDVMIVNLRQKLGVQGSIIETVRGIGYRAKEAAA